MGFPVVPDDDIALQYKRIKLTEAGVLASRILTLEISSAHYYRSLSLYSTTVSKSRHVTLDPDGQQISEEIEATCSSSRTSTGEESRHGGIIIINDM